jgi:hypothetical protein
VHHSEQRMWSFARLRVIKAHPAVWEIQQSLCGSDIPFDKCVCGAGALAREGS